MLSVKSALCLLITMAIAVSGCTMSVLTLLGISAYRLQQRNLVFWKRKVIFKLVLPTV